MTGGVALVRLDRPMDAEALEREALAAVAAAASTDEIEAVRVEYLGRKSALKLALREVRDRETGMALNAVRERLEAAIDAREAELARAELDRAAGRGARRRDAAGRRLRARSPPPDHADPARGRGRLPRARLPRRRRPRGRDDALQLRRAQLPARSSRALAARDALPRRRDGAAHGDVAVADPHDGGAAAARLHRLARPRLPPRHARRDAHADLPPGRGARRRRGHHARRPQGHARLPAARSSSARSGAPSSARTTSRSPSRRSRRTSRATSATAPAAPSAATPAGSRSAAPAWSTRSCSSSSATTPSATRGFAFGWGLERIAMLRHEFPDLRELWRNDLRFSRQF